MRIGVVDAQRRGAGRKRKCLVAFEDLSSKLQCAHCRLVWCRCARALIFGSEEACIEGKVVGRDHRAGKTLAEFFGDVFKCWSALEVGSADAMNMCGARIAAGIDKR